MDSGSGSRTGAGSADPAERASVPESLLGLRTAAVAGRCCRRAVRVSGTLALDSGDWGWERRSQRRAPAGCASGFAGCCPGSGLLAEARWAEGGSRRIERGRPASVPDAVPAASDCCVEARARRWQRAAAWGRPVSAVSRVRCGRVGSARHLQTAELGRRRVDMMWRAGGCAGAGAPSDIEDTISKKNNFL